MPELDGFGLLAAVRADPALEGVLVILLSARAGEEARVEGLAAGADDYLVKPFSARELRARVDGAVNLARQRRQAAAREKELQAVIAAERSHTLRQTEQELEFALNAGRLGSWELDLDTGRMIASGYGRANFGLGPDDRLERDDDVAARVHPEDQAHRKSAIDEAISLGGDFEVEYRTVTPDGQVAWVLVRGRAVRHEGGPGRLVGVTLNITERKKAEGQQQLLLDELNHRVKNTLATVISVAMQTRRFTQDEGGFEAAFFARVEALAQAHELLTEASWAGASLEEVIERTLAPYFGAGEAGRVNIQGPRVRLGPNAAVTLGMTFHELATNAAKYGALSTSDGRIDVQWRTAGADGPQAIEIDWRESRGPPVAMPSRRGFGSRLIEHGVARELAGASQLIFEPGGVWCRMRFPFSAKLSLAA